MRLIQNTKNVRVVGFLLMALYAIILIVSSIGMIGGIGAAVQSGAGFMFGILAFGTLLLGVAGIYLFWKLFTMFVDIYDALAIMQTKIDNLAKSTTD